MFKALLFILFVLLPFFDLIAQKSDSVKVQEPLKASANININNNGISLFPNLTYGKPAVILNVSLGKKGIFFEPELRWGLNGKPWSYIYWMRFKIKNRQHFGFNVGAHPSYVIRPSTVSINGKEEQRYISQRYVATEVVPVYIHSPKFQLGLYALYSKGLDSYAVQNSYFVSLQPRFPHIDISKKYYLSLFPQLFYLDLDGKKGTYINESLRINRKDCPVGISSIVTYKLKSTIPGDNFVWNVGLNVRF
ncbi:hypothetical protein EGI22_21475 [Lacihabitans sp. LS3-19]|uniref:hypothetical protein n=1 Tax=Lacihabitans sp. LS3-19 TaxID=2487335 RepID=UPI0020CDEA3B|nr:hypothetical protein [Lacihabitans sp. LS3-19]MCP9770487.1 hypothetical protein [Lacihabitans sp. LS3-19]